MVASIETPGVLADAARRSRTRRPTEDIADRSGATAGASVVLAAAASVARTPLSTLRDG
jgi:hypothetical protein